MNSVKRQKDMTLKDEPFRLVGVQYATGEERRNSTTRNQEAEPKWKQQPVVSSTESKDQCCKERYGMGNWNVRSTNQGKVELVQQELGRVNINILGINALTWARMSKFNSDDHYSYYCGQESLRKIGVALICNKTVPNAVLGAVSKTRE